MGEAINKINQELEKKNKLNTFNELTNQEIQELIQETETLENKDYDGCRILILDLLEKNLPVSERLKFFDIISEKTNISVQDIKKMYAEENKKTKEIKITTEDIEFPSPHIMFLINQGKRDEVAELITQKILRTNKFYTTRDDFKNEIWYYQDGIYVPNGRTYIKEFTRELLKCYFNSRLVNDIIGKVEVLTYINEDDFFQKENKDEIALLNGVLNIKTKKLYDFDPDKIFFNKLPLIYDPTKKCSNFINFLSEILENKEDAGVVQELFGYLIYKDYQIEKSFMFLGKGRNGKGQLLELMKKFVGVNNCSGVSLQRLCDENSFNISELHNKLVNIGGDIDGGYLETTGMFKQLSGNDLISAKRKFKNDLKFRNYSKMIFSCNNLPGTKDVSQGFWDRWILLKFPYRFEFPEIIETIPVGERRFLKRRVNNVVDTFTTDDELSGLLNWALVGLDRLLEKGHFEFTKSTLDVQRRWVREANSFSFFAENVLESDFDGVITKDDLRTAYNAFCRHFGVEALGDKSISNFMTREFGATSDRFRKMDVIDVRVWKRVSFKKDFGSFDDFGLCRFVNLVDFSEKFK